jgi:hypothetical protein
MQKYIGVKIVSAIPKKREVLHQEGQDRIPDQEGYKVVYEDGYESWCPKEVFEKANRPISGMTFGHAIEALKAGYKVARAGWNGKGMWLALYGGKADVLDVITMKTADNKILMGWLASQTDMLAEDWCIVE